MIHLIANLYCLNAPGQFIICVVSIRLEVECIAWMVNVVFDFFGKFMPRKGFQRT